MKAVELKITRIGNSRGVRRPADTLCRYGIGGEVIMEEKSDGILLRPVNAQPRKPSWEETALGMAAHVENWSDWETTIGDGLDDLPWENGIVAEEPGSG